MHFLSAPLLGGLALASIPIIIHLLNRRRFRVVDWAPMKYLKLTIKTNRRRLRIEQLILLAMRTLLIVLLFLAVARPVLSRGDGVLASRSRVSRFIVLDDSLSMGAQVDHRSAFARAVAAAEQLLHSIGAQDDVTVLTTSDPTHPLVHEASLPDPGGVIAQLDALTPTDAANHWPATLQAIDNLVSGATFSQQDVVILTDCRKSGWPGDVHSITDRWAARRVHVQIMDVGADAVPNRSVARLVMQDPVALANTPLKLLASVRNDTPSVVQGLEATLAVGDLQRPLTLPDLPPGQSTDIPLTVTPGTAGPLPIRLSLPADALPGDDVRWLAVDVRSTLDLLLINGTPGTGPFEAATDFLQTAFSVGAEPWRPQRIEEADWQTMHLPPADVIVLANVASIPPERAAELERAVRAGTGLMIFPGEQVDPQTYNDRLAAVLPAKLDHVDDDQPQGLAIEPLADSPLAMLSKVAPAALARIRPKRFMTVAPVSDTPEVRVLARWNDPEAHAAVLERRVGRGKVIFWTMSADRQWGDWPIDPTYVLATRSTALAIARPDPASDNVLAGQPIDLSIDGAFVDGQVTPPPPATVQSIERPRFDATNRAGPYRFTWKDSDGSARSRIVCANPDPAESDLRPIGDDELSAIFRPLAVQVTHIGNAPLTPTAGREIWRSIATILLVLAAAETAMAVWVGRER